MGGLSGIPTSILVQLVAQEFSRGYMDSSSPTYPGIVIDLGTVRGTYRMPVRDNIVPLSDGAGEVVEVGAGVTRVKVGDKVAGCFFQRWSGGDPPPNVQANALGGSIDGMLAEFVVLEEDGVVKIPAHLSAEEGATLPCAGVTA